MAPSPGDDLTDLDRLADAVVPSFRRKPSMPPPPASAKTSSVSPEALLLDVVIPPAAAVPRIDMAPDFGAREMKRESVPPASPSALSSMDAPRSDRNDATPLDIPQVIRIPSPASTPPSAPSPHDDSHNAATVRPPSKPSKKKQARSVPEPSVKAEASLHRPSPRVQPKDVGPKIVFNDPQAPSRQPTMAMARVTLQQAQSSVATLRPPPKRKTPFVPLVLAACAVIGMAAFVLKSGEAARDAQKAQEEPKPSAAAVAPAPAPVVDEVDRHVPPPPEEEDVPHEEPAPPPAPAPPPTPVDRAPDRSPAANSPLRTSPPMAAPALVAAPPATLPPSRAPEAPGARAPAPTVTAPHPPAPTPPAVKEAASAAAPLAPVPPPAPPKAPAPAKAANSAPAPAIVRDNPF
jgi:hypothetical protein